MTDYSEWTETEISKQDYVDLPEKRRGMDIRWRHGIRSARYFRLDPPAPKYREGEMRWLTDCASRWMAFRVDGGWAMRPEGDRVWFDASEITLSDPVVVVPAPSDEERAQFVTLWTKYAGERMPAHIWLRRVAAFFREQEATR